jgi:hypothetical protein
MVTKDRNYWLSLPERLLRSVVGIGAGTTREIADLVLPEGVRSSQLYRNLVEASLRFLIERVGGATDAYGAGEALPDDFLARRTAGNAVEVLGIVAFRASPVWILAALADLCGMGRQLIPEIAQALKERGLVDEDAEFASVDQLLDSLERTSSHLATTINAPPLDVAALRAEWEELRQDAKGLQPALLPSRESVATAWSELKSLSAGQGRSVFETSSVMAVSAVRAFPERVRWLATSAGVGAGRVGKILVATWMDHYRQTLGEIEKVGYRDYVARQFAPYLRAAVAQFSPQRETLTARVIDSLQRRGSKGSVR